MKNVLNNLKKFFKTDIKVINSYFLAITILVILVSVGLTSYALFSYAKISNNVIEGKVGKINYTTNFTYTGECTTYIAKSDGYYNLEVWGAQGGNYNTTYVGGLGGYSKGIVHLTKGTTLYVCVGGQPQTVTTTKTAVPGGFNGGGNGFNRDYSSTYTYGQAGGGATDIRIGQNSLYARVIVAGGGSGSNNRISGYAGGGTSGISGQSGYAGTQTSAGTGGSFGQGGSASTSGNNYKYGASGGGGGFYGGGAGTSYSDSTNYDKYSGGGSGYVYTSSTASSYPSGCLLNSTYYLTAASTTEAINTGNGKATITYIGKEIPLDTSGANAPVLASNMISVYYDETNSVWKKADVNNKNSSYQWYSYESSGNKKGRWANAVTVKESNRQTYLNATPGTVIPMDDITTMWVWIPRFNAVTPSNYNGGTQAKPNAIDVTFVKPNEPAIDAFTFGIKQLSGFWYGKFEISHTTLASSSATNNLGCTNETCANANGIIIKPNVKSLQRNNVSNFFFASRSMEQTGNSFGFVSSEVDTHMSKNNEWGAVAYLTQSIYGRCGNSTTCTEVYKNNSSAYYTGRSGDTPSDSNYTFAGTYEYNQNKVESTIVEGTGTNITPTITNNTTYPWINNNGVYSSGNKGKDSTTSTLTYTFTLTDKGAVLFDYSVSSENSFDKMKYTINKDSTTVVTGAEISGTSRGTTESSLQYENKVHVLEKGTYTLVFTYSKDDSGNTGLDKGYVKNVKVLNGVQTIDKFLPGGQQASTTGTIYGIYDMSGGSWEYVMGVLADPNGNPRSGYDSSQNSGFTGMLNDGTTYTGIAFPNSKYYNLYTGSSYTGHALTETKNWYSDYATFISTSLPWFYRSDAYRGSTIAGVFFFNNLQGDLSFGGSSRFVITNE